MIDDQKNLIAQNQVSDSTEYLEQLLDDLINIEDVEVEEQNRIFKKIFDTIEYYNVDGQIDLKIYFK